MRLDGRITLVTGAGSGIGRATAELFAEEGAVVVVNDLDGAAAGLVADAIGGPQAGAHVGITADVADVASVRALFEQVEDRFGKLDVLVNNAGISEGAPGEQQRINEQAEAVMADSLQAMAGGARSAHWDITANISDDSWRRMIAVHLDGTFFCCRAAIPLMGAAGGGSIVNTSSIGALTNHPGVPHYSAAKAGILGFTRSLAAELGSRSIRVNAVCPGTIDTPMTAPISPAFRAMVMATQPIGRLADAREVAQTSLFLASDESSFYTGQWLSPNGGAFM
jgi:3-oxoacyl-[acyl-carrier protein] reductase